MQSQQGVYIWRMPNPERGLYQTTLQSVRRDEDDEEAGPSNRWVAHGTWMASAAG